MPTSIQSAGAAVARAHRTKGEHAPETVKAREDLFAAHVERLVAAAPPLTDEQIVRVTAILRGTR